MDTFVMLPDTPEKRTRDSREDWGCFRLAIASVWVALIFFFVGYLKPFKLDEKLFQFLHIPVETGQTLFGGIAIASGVLFIFWIIRNDRRR